MILEASIPLKAQFADYADLRLAVLVAIRVSLPWYPASSIPCVLLPETFLDWLVDGLLPVGLLPDRLLPVGLLPDGLLPDGGLNHN